MFSLRRSESRFFILISLLAIACTSAAHGHEHASSDKKTGTSEAQDVRQSAQKDATVLEVEFVGPSLPASDKESADVLSALQKLLSGLGQRDIDQIGACLSQDVTMFDARSHKVVSGKSAVLEHIKSNVIGRESTSPVKRIAVHDPFVRIKGETAMVSFRATKKMADDRNLESWCSEVYERKDGQWLVLQFRSDWQPARTLD